MVDRAPSGAVAYTVAWSRNNSLSAAGRRTAFAAAAAVTLAIAAGFALAGAWVIAPFCGLELLLLWWVMRLLARQAGDFERITLAGDRLTLEARESSRLQRLELNPCWARVTLGRDPLSGHCRVALAGQGRVMEVGRFLDDNGRVALARELRRRTGFNHTLRQGEAR